MGSTIPVTVSGITSAVAVAAGGKGTLQYGFTCALLSGGGVQCWGYNGYGELGNGTTTNSPLPVSVSGIASATGIAAGDYHACARLANSNVQCWGYNGHGELGNGTAVNSSTPVTVSGISTAVTVAAGSAHTCARTLDSGMQCWGANGSGQLGNGSRTQSLTPVAVSGMSAAAAIAAGYAHTCAILSDGMAQCWGYDSSVHQLGRGSNLGVNPTPGYVFGISSAAALSWASSNPAVATIDQSGHALALSVGTTTITATYGGVSGSTLLTVGAAADTDGDGIPDASDNCTNAANASQLDTDSDGYGNRCDADFNQSNFVNITDLGIFKSRYGTTNADADLDGNGFVNITDLGIFKSLYGKVPGPSGVAP